MILDLKEVIKHISKIKAKTGYPILETYLTNNSGITYHVELPNNIDFLSKITREINRVELEITQDVVSVNAYPESIVGKEYFNLLLHIKRNDDNTLRRLFQNTTAIRLSQSYFKRFERLPSQSSVDDIDYI